MTQLLIPLQFPETSVYAEVQATYSLDRDSGLPTILTSTFGKKSNLADASDHSLDTFLQVHWNGQEIILQDLRRISIACGPQNSRQCTRYESGTAPVTRFGCVLLSRRDQPELNCFRHYAAFLILRARQKEESLHLFRPSTSADETITSRVIAEFEAKLLFDANKHVEWLKTGKTFFGQKICSFVSRGLPIQMALPAFPCKTSNPDKAAVDAPDGAEFLALSHIDDFCRSIGEIYFPGCFIDIISDGHVFSDCIGVDDGTVNEYNRKLQIMLHALQAMRKGPRSYGGIRFFHLGDLLHLDEYNCLASDDYKVKCTPAHQSKICHPVRTKTQSIHERHRVALMNLTSPPQEYLRDIIKQHPDHALTKLYRGFARFMFEDLAHHPDFKATSAKQRHKAAEYVALEMIRRNQAYSRFVEWVLPGHIRLSIHAHNNAGPKFAIRTLPSYVKYAENADDLIDAVVDGVDSIEQDVSRATLHIPTPWHNTLVTVVDDEGGHQTFICKAKVIFDAVKSNKEIIAGYDRQWVDGPRFILRTRYTLVNQLPLRNRIAEEARISVQDLRLSPDLDFTEILHNDTTSLSYRCQFPSQCYQRG